jgi:hypothetical protein
MVGFDGRRNTVIGGYLTKKNLRHPGKRSIPPMKGRLMGVHNFPSYLQNLAVESASRAGMVEVKQP